MSGPASVWPAKGGDYGSHGASSATKLVVISIAPDSPFVGTDLGVGMTLETINGAVYDSFDGGLYLLKSADGRVVIVASYKYDTGR